MITTTCIQVTRFSFFLLIENWWAVNFLFKPWKLKLSQVKQIFGVWSAIFGIKNYKNICQIYFYCFSSHFVTKTVVHLANFNKFQAFCLIFFFQENGRNILIFFCQQPPFFVLNCYTENNFKKDWAQKKKYIKPIAGEKTVEVEKIGLKET